ncbi:MAG: hypothetical protein KF858_03130 [Candidatus Sumerlaeia bacterium]|nr:hypothetical protein [Candidatus Sumerlaeia bacterium]
MTRYRVPRIVPGMTVRDVMCLCGRIDNFTEMVMCPLCGKALCKGCAVGAPQQAGCCGRRRTCHDQPPHPAAEGFDKPPFRPAPAPPAPRGWLARLLGRR